MGLVFESSLQVGATVISNDFIDRHMAAANGEYVKVYLYLMRHRGDEVTLSSIADALEHTESDVRRALAYWAKMGLLSARETCAASVGDGAGGCPPAGVGIGGGPVEEGAYFAVHPGKGPIPEPALRPAAASRPEPCSCRSDVRQPDSRQPDACQPDSRRSGSSQSEPSQPDSGQSKVRPSYTPEQMERLNGEEDFAQLLYIAQKYLKKVFTQRDSEVFAYLYDGLHMSLELLEYLVEYCAQNGHTSLRYVETVGLNWHKLGLLTVEEAKSYADGFGKDTYGVMKAFGLTDRHPADAEKEKIRTWYRTYGFSREIVLEACNRTMEAIHTPSFQYADKILTEWRKAGVKTMRDVEELDKRRGLRPVPGVSKGRPQARNQFHNFSQRDTDYDAMVLEQWKEQ